MEYACPERVRLEIIADKILHWIVNAPSGQPVGFVQIKNYSQRNDGIVLAVFYWSVWEEMTQSKFRLVMPVYFASFGTIADLIVGL
jgi:hypothetical protein